MKGERNLTASLRSIFSGNSWKFGMIAQISTSSIRNQLHTGQLTIISLLGLNVSKNTTVICSVAAHCKTLATRNARLQSQHVVNRKAGSARLAQHELQVSSPNIARKKCHSKMENMQCRHVQTCLLLRAILVQITRERLWICLSNHQPISYPLSGPWFQNLGRVMPGGNEPYIQIRKGESSIP